MNLTTPTVWTAAIKAQDFAFAANEPQFESWTAGKLRHLIDALGAGLIPVILTTDRRTGAVMVGVELVGLADVDTPEVKLVYRWLGADGIAYEGQVRLHQLGDTIVPLSSTADIAGRAKVSAIDSYREEVMVAIMIARAAHGEVEGRNHGRWAGEPMAEGVYVRYSPASVEGSGTPWQGRVVGDKVVASRSF